MGLSNEEVKNKSSPQHDFKDLEVNDNDVHIEEREGLNKSILEEDSEKEGILARLRRDAIYREKYLISLGIMWSFFVLVGVYMFSYREKNHILRRLDSQQIITQILKFQMYFF